MRTELSNNKKDRYDRIFDHIQKGKPLGKKDEKTLKIAREIYPMLCDGKTDREIVNELVENGTCKEVMAYHYVKHTKVIFAEVGKASKEAEKQILIQMAKKAYTAAMRKDDIKAANGAIGNLIKLYGFGDKEQNLTIVYQKLTLPILQITDNPEVIDMPIEDVKFEEE